MARKKSVKTSKIHTVMKEFKNKQLYSGSKKGRLVTNLKQAQAIALSEARKAGALIKGKRKRRK